MAYLVPIAISKVLGKPQSSLGLIASAKGLHQPLLFLDTASFDNNPTALFQTTPSPTIAAASTSTKVTSTTTCSVCPLAVAFTAVPAKHFEKTEGKALETASSPSARLRRMWGHPRHRASRQPSQDRQRCATSRPESSQPRWLLLYLVRRSRIPRCCPLRQQIPEQHRPPLSPRPMRARMKRAISTTSIASTSIPANSILVTSIPATSNSDTSILATLIRTTSTSGTLAFLISISTHSVLISRNSSKSGQLQRVLSAFIIRTIPIPEHLRKQLIEQHLRLDILSLAFNELNIHIASVTAPISSDALETVSGQIPMQFVDLRVPISSEPAGPSRYASPQTCLRRLRLPRARLKTQVRFGRAMQHSLARQGGTTAPKPQTSNITLEAAANSATATTSEPVKGASPIPTSEAAKKQRAPVSGGLAIPVGSPQFRTLQNNKQLSLALSAPWLTPTSQIGPSGTTTRPVSLLKLIVVAKSTGLNANTTTLLQSTCFVQPSLGLMEGTSFTSPVLLAIPTGSTRADDANYSDTPSSEPMTRARARGSPIKIVAIPTTLPPLDQTIFEHISLDESPRAAFEHSTVTESLADSFQFVKSDTDILNGFSNLPTSTLFQQLPLKVLRIKSLKPFKHTSVPAPTTLSICEKKSVIRLSHFKRQRVRLPPAASTSANSTSKLLEVVKLSAPSPKSENLTSDTHRQQASKQADIQRCYDLENCSRSNLPSEPACSLHVNRASTAPSVFGKPKPDLAVKRKEKEINIMQIICCNDVLMSVAVLVWRQEIHRTTCCICTSLEYGKSHMTKPHLSWSHLSITGPGPPLSPAIAGSLETAITATTTVSQLSQSASPTPVPLPSRTPRPHQPGSLVLIATWLTSAVPAAEQTTPSSPVNLTIVAKHPKTGAGTSEQLPEVSSSQPSLSLLVGAAATSTPLPGIASSLSPNTLPADDATIPEPVMHARTWESHAKKPSSSPTLPPK